MANVWKMVCLDYRTVKPYITLKNLLIYLFLTLILFGAGGASGNATAGFSVLLILVAQYISYPFAVGEKNGIDSLYATLSIPRRTVVRGRYAFALAVNVIGLLLAGIFSIGMSLAMGVPVKWDEMLITVSVLVGTYTLVQVFQIYLFFKKGYAKAKFMQFLPYMLVATVVLAASTFFQSQTMSQGMQAAISWVAGNWQLLVVGVVVLWAALVAISYVFAVKGYEKREF